MTLSPSILITLIVLSWSLRAFGLRCWTCQDARNEKDCRRNGRSAVCQSNQRTCETEVRQHSAWGTEFRITKGCKQTEACQNNANQNPIQCQPKSDNSVCRCCCTKNNCNKFSTCGQEKPKCKSIPKPENGFKRCSKENNKLGTVCKFSCKKGYSLQGDRISVCRRTADKTGVEFDRATPSCAEPKADTDLKGKSQCQLLPHAALHGQRICNTTEKGMVCEYSCGREQTLIGQRVMTCRNEGSSAEWNGEPPHCLPKPKPKCRWIPNPTNGDIRCNGVGYLGTMCQFVCDEDHELVGSRAMMCILDNGSPTWNAERPICRRAEIVPK